MNSVLDLRTLSAAHQPDWSDPTRLRAIREELSLRPPLVTPTSLRRLSMLLARAAAGEVAVVQAGDCAEDPAECTAMHVAGKAGLLEMLAGVLKMVTGRPVIRIGRIAGQFAKPRSKPTELVDDHELPSYFGHMVNRPEPNAVARQANPRHLLTGYAAASAAMTHLGWLNPANRSDICPPVWTSHEALLLDYELPMLRRDEDGLSYLGSTHWPWIGNRTRQLDGAHVALLASVVNPIACKVGPDLAADDLVELCQRLDPWQEPGRLTLIARMGADRVAAALPPLVEAVRAAGHPVIWLTDPMHGNTVRAGDGRKTRHVDTIIREVVEFQRVVRAANGQASGLHLEATPTDVTECVSRGRDDLSPTDRQLSLCDPRLNPAQAIDVVSAWLA